MINKKYKNYIDRVKKQLGWVNGNLLEQAGFTPLDYLVLEIEKIYLKMKNNLRLTPAETGFFTDWKNEYHIYTKDYYDPFKYEAFVNVNYRLKKLKDKSFINYINL